MQGSEKSTIVAFLEKSKKIKSLCIFQIFGVKHIFNNNTVLKIGEGNAHGLKQFAT